MTIKLLYSDSRFILMFKREKVMTKNIFGEPIIRPIIGQFKVPNDLKLGELSKKTWNEIEKFRRQQ